MNCWHFTLQYFFTGNPKAMKWFQIYFSPKVKEKTNAAYNVYHVVNTLQALQEQCVEVSLQLQVYSTHHQSWPPCPSIFAVQLRSWASPNQQANPGLVQCYSLLLSTSTVFGGSNSTIEEFGAHLERQIEIKSKCPQMYFHHSLDLRRVSKPQLLSVRLLFIPCENTGGGPPKWCP